MRRPALAGISILLTEEATTAPASTDLCYRRFGSDKAGAATISIRNMAWTKHSALTWSALLFVLTCVIVESLARNSQLRDPSAGRSAQEGPASRTRPQGPPRVALSVDDRQEHASPPDIPNTPAVFPNVSYDYLILVQQWGPGIYARNKECEAAGRKKRWTIHGLWPAKNNSESPIFCPGEEFNETVLDQIKSELNKYWPDLMPPKERNSTFWRYQWEKHGTCAGDIPKLNGTLNFFQTTLALYHKYNVLELLSNSRIDPSKEGTYSANQIINELSKGNRTKVELKCERVPNTKKQSVLTEIRFCLDKELEPIDCQGKNHGCGKHNYYPQAQE